MANQYSADVPKGFNVPKQVRLDSITSIQNENTLKNLGIGNNLAFKYYEGLKVYCKDEKTEYVWREVIGLETGLLDISFIYPTYNTVDGINYSGKSFNFFSTDIMNLDPLEFNVINKTVWNNGFNNLPANTSFGENSLSSITTGDYNSAFGMSCLEFNTTGGGNVAVGISALRENTTGSNNTTLGVNGLYSNTTGSSNTAIGSTALFANTTGGSNTAIGQSTLSENVNGSFNTAIGRSTLSANSTGLRNTAIGYLSLSTNTTGNDNTAIGVDSLTANLSGSKNTALGQLAGRYFGTNSELTNATNSIFLGVQTRALVNNSNNEIVIGYDAVGAGNDTITLGNVNIVRTVLRGVVANTTAYTVSTLPTGARGDRAYVTDALTPTSLETLTGGGNVTCPVFYNGVNWVSNLSSNNSDLTNLQKTITYPADFTGTNYTITNADNNYTIIVDNTTTAVTITVPSGLMSKIGVGFIQKGTADVTFVASGTTIQNPIGLKSKGQYYQTFIEQELATNVIYLLGNTKV
jgi:hypothetical protein